MILRFHWKNATRPALERERVEIMARNETLDRFGGVECAFRAYQRHRARPMPLDDWGRLSGAAIQAAMAPLTPGEKKAARIVAEFAP